MPRAARCKINAMDLAGQLTRLESSGLIRLAEIHPELEYLFRHALVQDAAYGSLVKADRRELHRAVGRALEGRYPDRLVELSPLLAGHYYEAGDRVGALKYYTLAGDQAMHRYANAEAAMHYTRALELAQPVGVEFGQIRYLHMSRGRALELSGQFSGAVRNYEALEELALQRGDRSAELEALMANAIVRSTTAEVHDPAKAVALLERAMAVAGELEDRKAEAKILWNLSLLNSWTGHPRESVEYGERSLAIARELGLREQLAYTLNDLSFGYLAQGRPEEASSVLQEARELWRELDNQPMLADNLARSGMVHYLGGDLQQSLQVVEELLRVSEAIHHPWGLAEALGGKGILALEFGELGSSLEFSQQSVQWAEKAGHLGQIVGGLVYQALACGALGAVQRGLEIGLQAIATAEGKFPLWRAWALSTLARVSLVGGDLERAEASSREAIQSAPEEDALSYPNILVADGEVGLALGDYQRALARADRAIEYYRKSHVRYLFPDAILLRGQSLWALGRNSEARETLMEAHGEAKAQGSRRSLGLILIALVEIETQRGNHAAAEELRNQARKIVAYVADHAGSPELRESFLRQPRVAAVHTEVPARPGLLASDVGD